VDRVPRAGSAIIAGVDDQDLLEAARRGDREALDTFVERYQARVLRFGLKMCRNPEDARDVAQETLLAAATRIAGFRGASSPSTWLFTIARRFCIKARRRSKFAPGTVLSVDDEGRRIAERVPDTHADPERALDDRRLAARLDSAIAVLEPKYREVLLLRDVEGLSAQEVAEVTGVGVAAVKSRLHRARLQLRASLSPLLGRVAGTDSTCADVVSLFSRHLEGEIDGATCADMEHHLTACAHCKASCDAFKRVLALCRGAATADVPVDLQESVRAGIRGHLARS
jgi:RNA polymerase sigma-70 factor (ECF subfamily)